MVYEKENMREITLFLHLCNNKEALRQECSGNLWESGTGNMVNIFPVPYTYSFRCDQVLKSPGLWKMGYPLGMHFYRD